MPKTASIQDDIHTLIVEKQKEIFNKYRVYIRISDIIAMCIRNSISNIEETIFKPKMGQVTEEEQGQVQDGDGGNLGAENNIAKEN